MAEQTDSWLTFKRFLYTKFNLDEDRALQEEVVENIRKGVEFKGTNLWVLIFATFVASIGLNVNSTAVIIGAMLISPLMGPIMGIGLSVGINDFELMKRSLKNFGFMIAVSILTSTLYFVISPLSTAQSELLARTIPTTWDVLIAFFGGLAGIVAQTRKDRTSTVIPGVAIATALMPPLCTAGFGLASGQFNYFFGAFYLFFINTVFIAVASFAIVRFLKYNKKVFLDKLKERRVKRFMSFIILVTIVPSVIIAYGMVEKSIFEVNADRYVKTVLKFEKAQIVDYSKTYGRKGSKIDVLLIGKAVSTDAIQNARAQLLAYKLKNTELIVRQAAVTDENVNFNSLQQNLDQLLEFKNDRIAQLEATVDKCQRDTLPVINISREISALTDTPVNIALSRSIVYDNGAPRDTVLFCLLQGSHTQLPAAERQKIINWLKVRTKAQNIRLYTE